VSTPLDHVAEAFAALGDTIYMNTASLAAGNQAAVREYQLALTEWAEGRFDWVAVEDGADETRRLIATLLGGSEEGVAMIPTVSGVAGQVAGHLALERRGGNIVVGAGEFSSNFYAWRQLADHGYEVRVVPFTDGGVSSAALVDRMDAETRLVTVSAVQSASGYRIDLAALREAADEAGALVFVDASQAAGAIPLDVGELRIDALATCSHKFLLGTRGVGYGYFGPALRHTMAPIAPGWAAATDPATSFYGPSMALSETASRFDISLAWFNARADHQSLLLMREIGFDAIHDHNRQLAEHMRTALAAAGIPYQDHGIDHTSTIFSLEPEVDDVTARLAEIDAVTSERAGRLRVALHLYNTTAQIDTVVAALTP
jgi:selenocysteine lyase/cysteine desulfurase